MRVCANSFFFFFLKKKDLIGKFIQSDVRHVQFQGFWGFAGPPSLASFQLLLGFLLLQGCAPFVLTGSFSRVTMTCPVLGL